MKNRRGKLKTMQKGKGLQGGDGDLLEEKSLKLVDESKDGEVQFLSWTTGPIFESFGGLRLKNRKTSSG